jgi:hypothetical protein
VPVVKGQSQQYIREQCSHVSARLSAWRSAQIRAKGTPSHKLINVSAAQLMWTDAMHLPVHSWRLIPRLVRCLLCRATSSSGAHIHLLGSFVIDVLWKAQIWWLHGGSQWNGRVGLLFWWP